MCNKMRFSEFIALALLTCASRVVVGQKKCNSSTEYSVVDKLSGSMKVLKCSKCRVCPPGFEPHLKCGTTIDVKQSIGPCTPCKDNFTSSETDVHQCKPCGWLRCFQHQVVGGVCLKDNPDTSFCMDKCESGFVMNKPKTACILSTTEKHPEDKSENGLVIGVLIGASFLFIILLAYLWKRRQAGIENSHTKENEPLVHNTNAQIHRQEVSMDAGKEEAKVNVQESSGGRVSSPSSGSFVANGSQEMQEINIQA